VRFLSGKRIRLDFVFTEKMLLVVCLTYIYQESHMLVPGAQHKIVENKTTDKNKESQKDDVQYAGAQEEKTKHSNKDLQQTPKQKR